MYMYNVHTYFGISFIIIILKFQAGFHFELRIGLLVVENADFEKYLPKNAPRYWYLS